MPGILGGGGAPIKGFIGGILGCSPSDLDVKAAKAPPKYGPWWVLPSCGLILRLKLIEWSFGLGLAE